MLLEIFTASRPQYNALNGSYNRDPPVNKAGFTNSDLLRYQPSPQITDAGDSPVVLVLVPLEYRDFICVCLLLISEILYWAIGGLNLN